MPRPRATESSFWARVQVGDLPLKPLQPASDHRTSTLHWTWHGSATAEGRPLVWRQNRLRMAYRVAWEYLRGPLKPREALFNVCGIVRCVNPAHYELKASRPAQPLWQRDPEFRLQLDNAYLAQARSEGAFCNQGHVLKPGTRRSNCPGCQADRRKRIKMQSELVLGAPHPPKPTPKIPSDPSFSYDLSGFMGGNV